MVNGNDKENMNISKNTQWIILGIGFVVMAISLVYGLSINNTASSKLDVLKAETTKLNNNLAVQREKEQKVRNDVIYKTTGIHPETVRSDGKIVTSFITDAFTWTSGEEYDAVRTEYIEKLGKDSPFVKTYLAENLTVDQYNYIDVNDLKSTFLDIDLYPLVERDGAMDYLGVVEYYIYKDDDDLVGKDRLDSSEAIVKLTITGEGDSRVVSTLTADPGFQSQLKEY